MVAQFSPQRLPRIFFRDVCACVESTHFLPINLQNWHATALDLRQGINSTTTQDLMYACLIVRIRVQSYSTILLLIRGDGCVGFRQYLVCQ